MKCSICIAAYDKPHHLNRVLESIFKQSPPFDFEVIVVDDGTLDEGIVEVCTNYPVIYRRLLDPCRTSYCNPAAARNVAYREATGEVIICQSDDVIHYSKDCIQNLVSELAPNHFVIATVVNVDCNGTFYADPKGKGYGDKLVEYTSPKKQRPLFFLGALCRQDLYAVGGNDEEFVYPSGEDQWFAKCLINGLGLRATYSRKVVGHHLHHPHTEDYEGIQQSQTLLKQKIQLATQRKVPWTAFGGPWEL